MRKTPDRTVQETQTRIAHLRALVAVEDPAPRAVLPLRLPAVEGHLPGGGLVLGPPHEIVPEGAGDGAAALAFALALVACHLAGVAGEAMIAAAPGQPLPYGHGLASLGLDPGRVLLMEAGGDGEVFRAFEAALHARCLSALVGLVGDGLPLKTSRRLQLAAEGGEAPLVLVLRPPGPGSPNGAATRWSVASAPGALDRFGILRAPRWWTRLERCRNGRGGSWLLEWDSAAHRLRLPERLARDAVAAGGAGP